MIGSPYEKTRFGTPTPLATAEQIGKDFFEFLGVKTLEEARALDAFEIRDKYSDFAKDHPRMYTVIDGVFCKEDPYKKMLEGRSLLVPLMAGNTSDEFLNHIEAKDGEQLLKKAEELFKDKADQFLSFEENKKQTPEGFSPISGIEYSVKRAFLQEKLQAVIKTAIIIVLMLIFQDGTMQAHSTRVIYGSSLRHLPNVGDHLTVITMIWRVRSAAILSTL